MRDGPARRHMRARRPDQRRPFSQVPVVVDFTATWCGPCQRIKPFFEELAAAHKGALFVKVDVDELESVSQAAEVLAMPTFQVYREGRRVGPKEADVHEFDAGFWGHECTTFALANAPMKRIESIITSCCIQSGMPAQQLWQAVVLN